MEIESNLNFKCFEKQRLPNFVRFEFRSLHFKRFENEKFSNYISNIKKFLISLTSKKEI